MRGRLSWLLALVAVAVLAGCPSSSEVDPGSDPVLAVLGDAEIRLSEFVGASSARTDPGEFARSGSGFEEFRNRLIWDLAFERILMDEASRRGFSVDESDVQGVWITLLAEAKDEEQLNESLIARFGSVDAWAEQIRRRLLAEMAEDTLRVELSQGHRFGLEEIVEASVRYRSELVRPARIRATQLFSPKGEDLDAALQELGSGKPYGEVAEAHSGIDMGWMSAAQAPDLLTRSVEHITVGKHTPILRSSLGYHIFILTGREPAARLTGEAESREVERLLKEDAVDLAIRDWLGQRAEALQLTLHEGNVAELRCCRLGVPYWGQAQQEVD